MGAELSLRAVVATDAAACLAIYRPNVEGSAISFELEVPAETELRLRIERIAAKYPWLVAESDGRLLGYAYATQFRARAAYDWCCETSVYVDARARGRGVARALYTRLLATLTKLGYTQALGVVTLPNVASVALHEQHGFCHVGTIDRAGWKLGRWHAIGIWQKELADRMPEAGPAHFGGALSD